MGAVDVARSTSTTAYGWMIGIWWSVEETKKKVEEAFIQTHRRIYITVHNIILEGMEDKIWDEADRHEISTLLASILMYRDPNFVAHIRLLRIYMKPQN